MNHESRICDLNGTGDVDLNKNHTLFHPTALRQMTEKERKQAEEEIKESGESLARAQEIAHVGSWELDLVKDELVWSDEIYRIFGLNPQEFGATYEAFLKSVHPDDVKMVNEAYTDSVESKTPYDVVHRILRPDGEVRFVHEKSVDVYDETGKTIRSVGTVQDITERVQTEERLKCLNESLKQRTLELARSNKDLEQFVYIASHDLQEPLRTISNYTKLLQRRYDDKFDSDAKEFMDFIIDGSTRMQHLIQDILEFSRIDRKEKEIKPADTLRALKKAISNLNAVIEKSQTSLTYDDLPEVMADESQLVRLFQNLLDNAIKFQDGRPPSIHVFAERLNGECLVAVRDKGIGFNPKYAERIFTIFQRLHRDEYAGTGLGLAISRRIVERHGGQIWAESKPGSGSTFYFTLPCNDQDSGEARK